MKRHAMISAATRDRLQRHLRQVLASDRIWLDPPASPGGTALLRIGSETIGTIDQDGAGCWAATMIVLDEDLAAVRG